jgi:hypothetical protein
MKHVCTMYRPETNKYVQACILILKLIVLGIFNVYTHTYGLSIHVCLHTCLELVHAMYIPGTYIKCTKTCFLVHVLDKQKFAGRENRTEDLTKSIQPLLSRVNHCASSVDTTQFTFIINVYCFTWRLEVGDVRSAPDHPPHPPPP